MYNKYEYLAVNYSNKIFNFERYGYEKEDIVQEFRIKIYTSIISYAEKWSEYKNTGKYKPVPIEYYLKLCMVNKVKDFIKLFNMENIENVDKISIENDGFDYSKETTISSVLSLKDNVCEINGVDLFVGLVGRKKQIFSDFLSGYDYKEISEKFPDLDVTSTINNQINKLQKYKNKLFDYSTTEFSMVTQFDE